MLYETCPVCGAEVEGEKTNPLDEDVGIKHRPGVVEMWCVNPDCEWQEEYEEDDESNAEPWKDDH